MTILAAHRLFCPICQPDSLCSRGYALVLAEWVDKEPPPAASEELVPTTSPARAAAGVLDL